MSTRSTIAVQHADNSISQIYCHFDGYPSHNGQILQTHYNTLELAEELVSNRDLSILGTRIKPIGPHSFEHPEKDTCVYYARDRGEHILIRKWDNLEQFLIDYQQEDYNYLFVNGVWKLVIDANNILDFQS
jgi:hypothetical protein